ncbi:polyhydroxyalkanoate depolymerase [Aquabacterium sp.]|uniref:polyhydroxyalkanoate depolymerase n=1 Tax=Aquabacterium sp. TaxID=1872578 RepID=UPI002B9A2C7D|nr:polyhydroxyalkanoate depolymerase [Aquabacterium sp.]HSW06078.1 polyhydroxyalkanoate depolymerase [Aquabacterium sp.]
MLYHAYQAQVDWLHPLQSAASAAAAWLQLGLPQSSMARQIAAACAVFSRLKLTHRRPPFGIDSVQRGDRMVRVSEEAVLNTPFATLLHFNCDDMPAADEPPRPRVLVVAPLSGHFATLLADTVRTMLADHDVYITDWHNARDVSLSHGRFGLDEYVQHLIQFTAHLGPGTHLLAVCQPCVPTLAAVALMAAQDHPAQPRTMTLMAGPIDCRINPTKVNELATAKPIEWFEQNLVTRVPPRFAGGGRRVYPGFLQLSAFMSMNPQRHHKAFSELYGHLAAGDDETAARTIEFYDEYFAVNDLAAEFYLETVAEVFQRYTLAKGELRVAGERVDTTRIRRTALFTVEGERDDICAIGQTVAAHDLCTNIRPYMKTHHVQLGVGHYGVFSGRRWQQQIYPRVREMIQSYS